MVKPPLERVRQTLNGATAIWLERLFVLVGVPSILGIAGWVLIAVINLQSLAPRIDILEEGYLLLSADRIEHPRHSSRDDAVAMAEHQKIIDARLLKIHRRLERMEQHHHSDKR